MKVGIFMAYFDNAATTFPKPEIVYNYTDDFYRENGVNSGRGNYKKANSANELITNTRKSLLDLFHCSNKKVVFTPSATIASNIILQGMKIKEKMNIYISPFEHNAIIRVLHYLNKKYDIKIINLNVDKTTMEYDYERIRYQFGDEHPDIMIINHASNVCGLIAPIEELCKMSKKYHCINIIDMSQTAGLIDANLSSDIFDYAIFAGHKTLYSEFGVGGFICKSDCELNPLLYGGTGFDSSNKELPNSIPEKFEIGSHNIRAIASLYASLLWINEIGISNIYSKEFDNKLKLLNILSKFDNIKLVPSSTKNSIGVVSCLFKNLNCDNVGNILNDFNISVRTGLHCAPDAHKFLGTFPHGTVRFSVGYFNDDKDFQELEEALNYIYENTL